MAAVRKCVFKDDPLNKYIMDNSLAIHPVMQELNEITLKHEWGIMIGDPICLNLLKSLMQNIKAKRVLDIGVFTGCSTLNAALAIPDDGKIVALDVNEDYANIGKPFWEKAGVAHKIDLRIAPALDSLDAMIENGEAGTFDFAFIDADKTNYPNYFKRCLKLIRSGGIMAFDNALQSGTVADPSCERESTVAIRETNKMLHECDKVNVSLLNIGDGLNLAFVK